MQFLYCFENPASYNKDLSSLGGPVLTADYPLGLHRLGLSFKADLGVGLLAECLYTINLDTPTGIEGLSVSAGVDYTIFDGNLYLLAEYLYSGNKSVSAQSAVLPSGHSGLHYLYAAGTWKFSDFASITAGCAANMEDFSCTPLFYWQYEFVQGMLLTIRALFPLDKDSFNAGNPGELGPKNSGRYAYCTIGLKVKF
jgi:hypothetical protein